MKLKSLNKSFSKILLVAVAITTPFLGLSFVRKTNEIESLVEGTTGSVIGPTELITYKPDSLTGPNSTPIVVEQDKIEDLDIWAAYSAAEVNAIEDNRPTSWPNTNGANMRMWATINMEAVYFYPTALTLDSLPTELITFEAIKDDVLIPANVKRIVYNIDEQAWYSQAFWGENTHAFYSYRNFLRSAARFPRYCGQKSMVNSFTQNKKIEEVCAMELAFTFANFSHYTNGLTLLKEAGAPDFVANNYQGGNGAYRQMCNPDAASSRAFPCGPQSSDPDYNNQFPNYQGRGAMQIKEGSKYGYYSRVEYGPENMGQGMRDPNFVAGKHSELAAFTSGIFIHMLTSSFKPSPHLIASGIWEPSVAQAGAPNMEYGFGANLFTLEDNAMCYGWNGNANTAAPWIGMFRRNATALGVWENYGSIMKNDCYQYGSGNGSHIQLYPSVWQVTAHKTTMDYIHSGITDDYPFSLIFPGDGHRAVRSTGGLVGDAQDYNRGLGGTYTPGGAQNRAKVYGANGWVSQEDVIVGRPIANPISTITINQDSITNSSVSVSVSLIDGENALVPDEDLEVYLIREGGNWQNSNDRVGLATIEDPQTGNYNIDFDLNNSSILGSTSYEVQTVGSYYLDDLRLNTSRTKALIGSSNSFLTRPADLLSIPVVNFVMNHIGNSILDFEINIVDNNNVLIRETDLNFNNQMDMIVYLTKEGGSWTNQGDVIETFNLSKVKANTTYYVTFRNLHLIPENIFDIHLIGKHYATTDRTTITTNKIIGSDFNVRLPSAPDGVSPIASPRGIISIDQLSSNSVTSNITFLDQQNAIVSTTPASVYLLKEGETIGNPSDVKTINNPSLTTDQDIDFNNLDSNTKYDIVIVLRYFTMSDRQTTLENEIARKSFTTPLAQIGQPTFNIVQIGATSRSFTIRINFVADLFDTARIMIRDVNNEGNQGAWINSSFLDREETTQTFIIKEPAMAPNVRYHLKIEGMYSVNNVQLEYSFLSTIIFTTSASAIIIGVN